MITLELGDIFFAFLINLLHSLFAFSVTEHVLIINKSAPSLKELSINPLAISCLFIVDVSEKLSLHPNV